MLNRAFHLSSTWESFKSECDHLKVMFTNLKYPETLIKSTICRFVTSVRSQNPEVQTQSTNENSAHRVVLQFKDQKSADAVRKQLSDLSNKIDHTLQVIFQKRVRVFHLVSKLEKHLKPRGCRPSGFIVFERLETR